MAVVQFRGASSNRESAGFQPPPVGPLNRAAMVNCLIDMAEWARSNADTERADLLLLAAWSMYDDRRADIRVPVDLPVYVTIDSERRQVFCVNLSTGGAMLACDNLLPDSGTVILAFQGLPMLKAVIVEGQHNARVRFTDLSPDQTAALELFLGKLLSAPHQIREAVNLVSANPAG